MIMPGNGSGGTPTAAVSAYPSSPFQTPPTAAPSAPISSPLHIVSPQEVADIQTTACGLAVLNSMLLQQLQQSREREEAAQAERGAMEEEPDETPVPGCRIYRRAIPLETIEPALPRLRERVKRHGEAIIAGQSDGNRLLAELPPNDELSGLLRDKLRALGELRGRGWSGAHVLHSSARCHQQKRHWDYNPDLLEGRRKRKPASALLALESGTRIIFFEDEYKATGKVPVQLHPGDLLVFEGEVSHAGASYAQPNTRVHVYLDVPDVKREQGVVWFKRVCHRV